LQSHHSKGSEVCCNVFFPFSKSCIARGLRSSNLVLQLTWRYYCRTLKKQQPISRYISWDIWPTAKVHNSNVMAVDGFLLHRRAALVVWDFMPWIHSLVVWDFMSWIHSMTISSLCSIRRTGWRDGWWDWSRCSTCPQAFIGDKDVLPFHGWNLCILSLLAA
jgi:hypothetical protein